MLLATGMAAAGGSGPVSGEAIVEDGSFHLYKFEQDIGMERYRISRTGALYRLTSDFRFVDRGMAVPLTTTLLYSADLTAQQLRIRGKIARPVDIDDEVDARGGTVHVRRGTLRSTRVRPARFFLVAGYAPTAVQMLMMRYWQAHGSPGTLATFPQGEVRIEHRGRDRVTVDGKAMILERYLLHGMIWGQEAVWLDASHRLVALVGVDAELDHFESVRQGFESALPQLVASAGRDEMATLAELGRKLPGTRAPKLALVGGTVIDGTGAAPIPDAVVVLERGRIAAVGPRDRITIPADATRIDVQGKTLLPGLWDMHAHFEQVEWGPLYLAAGVTTVRDCGNELEFITAVRDAIRARRGLGPRLLMAGIVDGSGPAALGIQRVDTPEQGQHWVERYHAAGFAQMKIYSSMTREGIAAVASAAHALGMSVTGHIPLGLTLREGLDAGMDQVNHIVFILDAMVPESTLRGLSSAAARAQAKAAVDVQSALAQDIVQHLKQHDIVVDPTVALTELQNASRAHPIASIEPGVRRVAPELAVAFAEGPAPSYDPNGLVWAAIQQRELDIIGTLHRSGVTIVAGTDQAVPGFSLYRELELYVKAGFTPMDAIQAATVVPARVMHLERETGTLEKGKAADLIVLGRDPLASISNLRSVEKVITAGALYETGPLWESVGFRR
jgi:imidazolonepropionase-like amidohydrolase